MYEIFSAIIEKLGLTVADVSRGTGIPETTLSNWKKRNNIISAKHGRKIADFLGVPFEYLMTGEMKSDGGYYTDKETAETAQEIFLNPDLRMLFDAARDASPEDLRYAAELLMKFKGKSND